MINFLAPCAAEAAVNTFYSRPECPESMATPRHLIISQKPFDFDFVSLMAENLKLGDTVANSILKPGLIFLKDVVESATYNQSAPTIVSSTNTPQRPTRRGYGTVDVTIDYNAFGVASILSKLEYKEVHFTLLDINFNYLTIGSTMLVGRLLNASTFPTETTPSTNTVTFYLSQSDDMVQRNLLVKAPNAEHAEAFSLEFRNVYLKYASKPTASSIKVIPVSDSGTALDDGAVAHLNKLFKKAKIVTHSVVPSPAGSPVFGMVLTDPPAVSGEMIVSATAGADGTGTKNVGAIKALDYPSTYKLSTSLVAQEVAANILYNNGIVYILRGDSGFTTL